MGIVFGCSQNAIQPVVIVLVGACAIFGQAPSASQAVRPPSPLSAAVSDAVLYRTLFERLVTFERAADRLRAQGKSSANLRSSLRRVAQLTEREDAALKSIARDYSTQQARYRDQRRQLGAMTRSPRTTLANAQAVAFDNEKWRSLRHDEQAMLLQHIAQLKTVFGRARFHSFDRFVRSTVAPIAALASPRTFPSPSVTLSEVEPVECCTFLFPQETYIGVSQGQSTLTLT